MNDLTSNRIKELLVKLSTKQVLCESEMTEIEIWKAQSEGNKRLLKRITSSSFIEKALFDDNIKARNKSLNKLMQKIDRQSTSWYTSKSIQWIASIAASLIIGIFIFIQSYTKNDIPPIVAGIPQATLIKTDGKQENLNKTEYLNVPDSTFVNLSVPKGSEFTVKLSDGTKIHLFSESSIIIPEDFSKDKRLVHIKGEGHFEVSHNENSPFTVKTHLSTVRVLGTIFNIKDYGDKENAFVTLIKGKVEVSNKENKTMMQPNMRTEIPMAGKIATQRLNAITMDAIEKGNIIFNNESLENIMHDVGRRYNVDIQFENEKLEKLKFTLNVSRHKKLNEFLSILEKVNKVKFSYKNNVVHIHKK